MDRDDAQRRIDAAADVGWLDGFAAVLWTLVGERLAEDYVVEYQVRVRRVARALGIEGVDVLCQG